MAALRPGCSRPVVLTSSTPGVPIWRHRETVARGGDMSSRRRYGDADFFVQDEGPPAPSPARTATDMVSTAAAGTSKKSTHPPERSVDIPKAHRSGASRILELALDRGCGAHRPMPTLAGGR